MVTEAKNWYQVGCLQFIRDDDPKFVDYFEAVTKAEELSIDDSIYGVWDEDGELQAVVYQGERFEK